MNIQDTRRENLRIWAKEHGVPPDEKSYFSQLFGGASFGERAARRLEKDYKMGAGYLDRAIQSAPSGRSVQRATSQEVEDFTASDEFIELTVLYWNATKKGRDSIIKSARKAEQAREASWRRAVVDET
ncbi:hypothetical protein EGT07_26290 [Herbaspirillum sp. HC18]|nr:hypothetical protein EGT07_26290 [Herbaspirillum sp. HC18]